MGNEIPKETKTAAPAPTADQLSAAAPAPKTALKSDFVDDLKARAKKDPSKKHVHLSAAERERGRATTPADDAAAAKAKAEKEAAEAAKAKAAK